MPGMRLPVVSAAVAGCRCSGATATSLPGVPIQVGLQDLELGRPGIWLRIDLEKPPSTQMSCPVT